MVTRLGRALARLDGSGLRARCPDCTASTLCDDCARETAEAHNPDGERVCFCATCTQAVRAANRPIWGRPGATSDADDIDF